ncbi:MAG: hypothetical protein FK730_06735 [Asgard group archaeon]|nr:hypothetical protein [Asgard group archaeon]
MKRNQKIKLLISLLFAIFLIPQLTKSVSASSYTKQDFVVNNETEVLLDIDTDVYYNGTITITVTEGEGINATVNGITKEILLDETDVLIIDNTTEIYFTITSNGLSRGFFEIELNIDPEAGGKNPIRLTVGILAAFLLVLSVVSYYIRSKRLETKPDEDEETLDPDVVRRRREAAGAEKKFWGLDEKK